MSDRTATMEYLQTLTILELESQLEDVEHFYTKKGLVTSDYEMCVKEILIVLQEKRQEQECMDAFNRAMIGI